MKVERQGPYECGLATMAALHGCSLAEVLKVNKGVVVENGYKHFYSCIALDQTARRLDPSGVLAHLCGFWQSVLGAGHVDVTNDVKYLSARLKALPTKGRGVVRSRGRTNTGHIAPWENGLVYNSLTPDLPQTLAEYRKSFPRGWHIDYITVEI